VGLKYAVFDYFNLRNLGNFKAPIFYLFIMPRVLWLFFSCIFKVINTYRVFSVLICLLAFILLVFEAFFCLWSVHVVLVLCYCCP